MSAKVALICQSCRSSWRGCPGGRWCPSCRGVQLRDQRERYWATHKKYLWTPERDQYLRQHYDGRIKGRAKEIGDRWGWPKWLINRRAALLGLSHAWPLRGRAWTKAEEAFLEEHAGSRTVQWMCKRLKRPMTSVVLKLKRLNISRRWREGYTLRDLEDCFGIDHHGIDRWIRDGKLVGRRRGTDRQGPGGRANGVGQGPADPWVFTDADLIRFIREHPTAFRLDKVDQVWFMDLVIGGGLLRPRKETSAP